MALPRSVTLLRDPRRCQTPRVTVREAAWTAVARDQPLACANGPEGSGTAAVRARRSIAGKLSFAEGGGASYLPDASTEVDSQSSGEAGRG